MKVKQHKNSLKKPEGGGAVKVSQAEPLLGFFYGLILVGYSLIAVMTPDFFAFDSNGPKFYSLSILNLVAFGVILIGNRVKPQPDFYFSFFRTRVGFVYTLFLLVALLSFFKAFNILESIINFSKLFTIFSAALIIAAILRKDKRYLYVILVTLSLLLIFDSLTVFYQIGIKKMTFWDVKSVYANKNILSSAIFVKMSLVLWLMTFGKGWMKALGALTLLIAFVAILFMKTRSFYIGSFFLIITYGLFMIIRFYKNSSKLKAILFTISIPVTVIVVFLSFSMVMKYINPESGMGLKSGYLAVVERLMTLSQEKAGMRIQAMQNSVKLIRANPILGVGTGNWKIEVLKYEGPTTAAYIYMYKTHNDFLETTTETGIIGGALYLGLFILVMANFIRAFFRAKKGEEESYKWLFLPAFGLFCYSFDALFNFPADRPEIASLFALFVGAGIAFSPQSSFVTRISSLVIGYWSLIIRHSSFVTRHSSFVIGSAELRFAPVRHSSFVKGLVTLFFFLMLLSTWIFYLNFESLKLQATAYFELSKGPLVTKSESFMKGFPAIPNLNVQGEPIAVTKARYLEAEGKYQEVLDLLKRDHSSPYDSRPEFYIAMAYAKLGQPDSALVYAKKAYALKPYFSGSVSVMSTAYEANGDPGQAMKVLDDFIQLNTKDGQAIPGFIYTQKDLLQKQNSALSLGTKSKQFQDSFKNAMASFGRKDYNKAITLFSEAITLDPSVAQAYEYRAFCYFYLNNYPLSLKDIEKAIALDPTKPGDFNLRGVNQHLLGNDPAACIDFQKAMGMGDKDAGNNYEKFCKKVTR